MDSFLRRWDFSILWYGILTLPSQFCVASFCLCKDQFYNTYAAGGIPVPNRQINPEYDLVYHQGHQFILVPEPKCPRRECWGRTAQWERAPWGQAWRWERITSEQWSSRTPETKMRGGKCPEWKENFYKGQKIRNGIGFLNNISVS